MNLTKVRWVAEHGSIFAEVNQKNKFEFTGFKEIRPAIAFNIGNDLADHLVSLHNKHLEHDWKTQ